MAGFMERRVAFFLVADNHAAPLRAHHDFVFGKLEIMHINFVFIIACRQESSLIDEVFEISAGESRSGPGQHSDIDIGTDRNLPGVYLEYSFATLHVRPRNDDPAIKPTG